MMSDMREAAVLFINNRLKEARELLRDSVAAGDPLAAYVLYRIYRALGWVETYDGDDERALELLKQSFEGGDPAGSLEYVMSPLCELAEEEAAAVKAEMLPKLRELAEGGPETLPEFRPVAETLLAGIIMAEEPREALRLLESSAEAGYWQALEELGKLYLQGEVTEADPAKAVDLFRRGTELKSACSYLQLGLCLAAGSGVEEDLIAARHKFEKAYRLGTEEVAGRAAYELCMMYKRGTGAVTDDAESAGWAERAVEAGYEPAFLELANCYFTGRGVKKNVDYANELQAMAAKGRSDAADDPLSMMLALQ